uniref:U5 small nuclear ribonucleoprotein TSSC4 n=2 Tax=Timema TaxID=61471 RepID=A0A7R9HEH0_TIMPO|nr:unnamed protein product [Timema douglasi]CAD7416355.1 unnamed protein product [Timema poppensis]
MGASLSTVWTVVWFVRVVSVSRPSVLYSLPLVELVQLAEKEKDERQKNSPNATKAIAEGMNVISTTSLKRKRTAMKQFRGKESIFKRPEALPPRFKNKDVPDYHKHPHKWVRYTLGDVSPEDMSDQSNTAAALSFLRELKERKELIDTNNMELEVSPETLVGLPVVFHKPKDISCVGETQATESEKAVFRSSKLIMPEYVVGQSRKKERKNINKSKVLKDGKPKEIKLDHLNFEDNIE